MSDWIGQIYGKVRVEKLIARGGMAEVYYGIHTTLNRPVAIKVLLSHLEDQPELKTRFEREARVLAGLRHPNIVQIYDFDVINDQPFIVMEYLGGPTLSAYLRATHSNGGRLTLTQIGRLLVMLAAALDYAHVKGVIHRDIKPANVLITSKTATFLPGQLLPEDAEPILTDFGLLLLTDASSRSISGTVSGTPAYMSPEQARGERVDYRSDLYSLGVMLYEMLAGKVPFEADTSMGVLLKHIQEPPPPIPDFPISLQNVLDRALSKKPGDRYPSARELVRAYLNAAGLTIADVAPGYVTPQPGSISSAPSLASRLTLPPDIPPPTPTGQAIQPAVSPNPTPTPAPRPSRSKKTSAWVFVLPVAALAFIGMCLLFSGGAAWVFRDSLFARPAATLPTATEASHNGKQPTVSPAGTPGHAGHATEIPIPAANPAEIPPHDMNHPAGNASFGRVRFFNLNGFLDEVILTATGIEPAPDGFQYEAWLAGAEVRRSLGVLALDAAGNAGITFVDDKGGNLLTRYNRMEITLEPNPDSSPNPSGNVAYSSGIPPMALDHVRHLLVAYADTPNQTGMLVGQAQAARLLNEHAAAMLGAYERKKAAEVRKNAEAMVNILVGKQGQGYGDPDKDGKVNDPSDGYGLLLNGGQEGYIEGTISHAGFAADMPDASQPIRLHAGHVVISAKNMEGWASELRDLLAKIIADPLGADSNANIRLATSLADRILNGRDLNGNEAIEPIEGEGGVKTALEHALYMLDMSIMAGANRLPPPAPAESAPVQPPGYGP